jgi:hypothetical protein
LVLRHAGERTAHALRAGIARTGQLSRNPLDSGSYTPRAGERAASFASSDFPNPAGYQNDTGRGTLGYQLDAQLGASHLVSAGADLEHETGEIGDLRGGPAVALAHQRRRLCAGPHGDPLAPVPDARRACREERQLGTRAVPRAAAALRLGPASRVTTLRASAGAGIKEPSFLQSFGVSEFALATPTCSPSAAAPTTSASSSAASPIACAPRRPSSTTTTATRSPTRSSASIPSAAPTRTWAARAAAASSWRWTPPPSPRLRVGAQYTLLDGEILESASTSPLFAEGQPLLRRPKHQGSLWASANASRVSGGLNLLLVGSRSDSDFFGIGLTENEAYARLDARLRVSVAHGIEAFAVAENLLDREYQEILGFPALGRALRFGVRYRSREPRP